MAHIAYDKFGIKYLSDDWFIDDIKSIREDLSVEECVEVLQKAADYFDANVGVNWEVLSYIADDLFPEGEN